jgi:hypothetical protein
MRQLIGPQIADVHRYNWATRVIQAISGIIKSVIKVTGSIAAPLKNVGIVSGRIDLLDATERQRGWSRPSIRRRCDVPFCADREWLRNDSAIMFADVSLT